MLSYKSDQMRQNDLLITNLTLIYRYHSYYMNICLFEYAASLNGSNFYLNLFSFTTSLDCEGGYDLP